MLTELTCKNARAGERDRKLADAHGLFLLVKTTGYKVWRLKYRHGGKEKQLTIGPWPEISLKQARAARDDARMLLREGSDPMALRKNRKAASACASPETLEQMARAWHRISARTLTARYAGQILSRLEHNVFPTIGAVPVKDVTAPMVLEVIRKVEQRGATEMAHRIRIHLSAAFVWAKAAGIADNDPADMIRKALEPTAPKLRPAVLKIELARRVLKDVETLERCWWPTALASRLLALTAARPGVIRLAERGEFEDLDGALPLWRIPAEKMKLTRERKRDASHEFIVPLSRQAVATVKAALHASPSEHWLFPGAAGWRKPISDSTLSKQYRVAGYSGRHVPHGWRATFSTIMNERAAAQGSEGDRAIIDLMLAHMADGVEPIYNRAVYMPRRRELAQDWADLLMEGLAPPERLLPPALRP